MKYFLHDSNAFNDEKVSELFIQYGYEGLGLFYTILEKIAFQEKPIKTAVLKHQLKVGKKLQKCWSFMESIELISSNNGETFNKQLLNFSESYKIKKEKNAKRILNWRENQLVTENVTQSENARNAPKVKVSKVKVIDKELSEFDAVFEKYLSMRVSIKKPATDYAQELIKGKLEKFSNGDEKLKIQILNQSIESSWQDVFPLKHNSGVPQKSKFQF